MLRVPACIILFLLALASMVRAQVDLSLSLERPTYLLFEPITAEVEIRNLTDKMIVLSSDPVTKEPWIQFVIQSVDNKFIKTDVPIQMENKVIQPNGVITISLNVAAHYRIRTTGQYRIQAVVKTNNDISYMTPNIVINIGNGETIWKTSRTERTFSLVRFLVGNQTCLYLRIEDLEKNIVYCTHMLGACNLSYPVPDPIFDNKGNIHILHARSPLEFRHTTISRSGAILGMEEYDARWNMPKMATDEAGNVVINGTKASEAKKQERSKLSDSQVSVDTKTAPAK